ncbi:MAG: hypothetical protein CM15mP46_4030 [Alphaproteobacteria bacterium]|nr:MAG: hypothetical protein CM15mP46_4030 [Alphaproteobacteria bacterium]
MIALYGFPSPPYCDVWHCEILSGLVIDLVWGIFSAHSDS